MGTRPALQMALLLACLAGCAAPPPPDPEVLLTPVSIQGDFLVRQKISGEFHGHKQSFEAALQKQGAKMTVLGLTPYGTKAFVLIQDGDALTFENHMPKGRSLPLQPKYLLQDIYHAFFLDPTSETSELCDEDREGDQVVRRTFRRRSDPDGPAVVVGYSGPLQGGGFREQVSLENGYYGYSLTIQTVSYQALD
jgi:hypothetical protein